MKLLQLVVLLLSVAALALANPSKKIELPKSSRALDRLCGSKHTAALASDLCKDYKPTPPPTPPPKKTPPPPPPKKSPPLPPPCKKVGEYCKYGTCCDGLVCRTDAKNKDDIVCYKPCVPHGKECGKHDRCCEKDDICLEK